MCHGLACGIFAVNDHQSSPWCGPLYVLPWTKVGGVISTSSLQVEQFRHTAACCPTAAGSVTQQAPTRDRGRQPNRLDRRQTSAARPAGRGGVSWFWAAPASLPQQSRALRSPPRIISRHSLAGPSWQRRAETCRWAGRGRSTSQNALQVVAGPPTCKQADLEGSVAQGFREGPGTRLPGLRPGFSSLLSKTLGRPRHHSVPRFPLFRTDAHSRHLFIARGLNNTCQRPDRRAARVSCRPCDSLLGAGATPAKPTGPSAAPGTAPINTARVGTTKEPAREAAGGGGTWRGG